MALRLRKPIQIAAIDAGSNAFRLMIARILSTEEWEIVESVRAPVRLGHSVFTSGMLDPRALRDATAAFREFRRIMDARGVTAYRAVTTSAAREARNGHLLIDRVRKQAKIDLEIISGEEEARLVRVAVLRALRDFDSPRFILDLGGGSLELNELRRGVLQESIGLPIGTVRLMEAFKAQGVIHEHTANEIRLHVLSVLQSALPGRPRPSGALAVACGGNAETLAALASGPKAGPFVTLNPRLLRDRLWHILQLNVEERMKAFSVRRDRAEVMGVAAIVLVTVAWWLRLRQLVTPRVGVREGLLFELAATQLSQPVPAEDHHKHSQEMLAGAESYAFKLRCDLKHAEQVRALALQLFDQLWPYHHLDQEARAILASAAMLHDCGVLINRKAHHRHGEYLIHNAKIPGLRGWAKNMIAALVRYHNRKSEPSTAHSAFAALTREQRKKARILAGMLRLAERLESDHRQGISKLTMAGGPRDVRIYVELREASRLNLAGIERKARLLERELNLHLAFQRVLVVEKVKEKARVA
ncbi:MAG TPA: Ppx/GppA phosphatase family protein [Verrucomicrobiae bacterium]|nr:Ppx/GppA phosphatase family protein [Verrucomicrobiae bacterium]